MRLTTSTRNIIGGQSLDLHLDWCLPCVGSLCSRPFCTLYEDKHFYGNLSYAGTPQVHLHGQLAMGARPRQGRADVDCCYFKNEILITQGNRARRTTCWSLWKQVMTKSREQPSMSMREQMPSLHCGRSWTSPDPLTCLASPLVCSSQRSPPTTPVNARWTWYKILLSRAGHVMSPNMLAGLHEPCWYILHGKSSEVESGKRGIDCCLVQDQQGDGMAYER